MSVWGRDRNRDPAKSRGRRGEARSGSQEAAGDYTEDLAAEFVSGRGQCRDSSLCPERGLSGGEAGPAVETEKSDTTSLEAVRMEKLDALQVGEGAHGQALDRPCRPGGPGYVHPGQHPQHGPAAEGGPAVGGV